MNKKTFCTLALWACTALLGGCAGEVDDELTRTETDGIEEAATDDTLDPSAGGVDELHDQLLCNKTCVLECGDCSCCL